MNPRPLRNALEAVKIAKAHVGKGVYWLGTGDLDTPPEGKTDCFGFAVNKCYGIPRHRPGFNHGNWATVSDDLNSNSAIEDAHHARDLFEPILRPEVGAILAYPNIRLVVDGKPHKFTGHAAIIVAVPPEWDVDNPDYARVTIVQCIGPNGRKPGIVRSLATAFQTHDHNWPKFEHRTHILRVKP